MESGEKPRADRKTMDRTTNALVAPFSGTREPCPLERWIDIFTGAWTLRILWVLMDQEPHRFVEIERRIGPVSAKVLASKLRDLGRNGIIERIVIKSSTPHVEYRLTERGKLLTPVYLAMQDVAHQMF